MLASWVSAGQWTLFFCLPLGSAADFAAAIPISSVVGSGRPFNEAMASSNGDMTFKGAAAGAGTGAATTTGTLPFLLKLGSFLSGITRVSKSESVAEGFAVVAKVFVTSTLRFLVPAHYNLGQS